MKNLYAKSYIKKIWALSVVLTVATTGLSGCKLAENDAMARKLAETQESTNTDVFVGIFLSEKNLFEETANWILEENDVFSDDKEVGKYEEDAVEKSDFKGENNGVNKIYAVRKEVVEEDGYTHVDYIFEGCEGIGLYYFDVTDETGEMSYTSQGMGTKNSASDVLWNHKTIEGKGMERVLDATVYINKLSEECNRDEYGVVLYQYDVYQTYDGKVYMTQGEYNLGSIMSDIAVSGTTTIDKNGEEHRQTCSVNVQIELDISVEKTILRQMNLKHEIINSIEIDNSNIPEAVELESDTEYVVVEKYIDNEMVDRYTVDTVFDERLTLGEDENTEEDEDTEENSVGFVELTVNNQNEFFLERAKVELKRK